MLPPHGPDPDPPAGLSFHDLAWDDLAPRRAHDVVRLRVDVFVVEQACPYPELDGRDLEPGARHHLLVTDTDAVAAYLRVLDDVVAGPASSRESPRRVGDHAPGQASDPVRVQRVGRVVTAPDHRRRGLARWLVDHAVAGAHRPVVLDAQAHLADWYAASGFRVTGPEFLEDGIPHVPMRRDPDPPGPRPAR